MEYSSLVSIAVEAGYTVELSPKATFRHSTKLGGVTVHLNLTSLQATVTIDGLGSKSQWSSSWRHYKLKRRNITLAGMEAMLNNPFRGTFCEPLGDGWVEHGSVVHRHTDHNMPGGPGLVFGAFFQMMFAHFADVDVIHLDLLANHNLNINDEVENNDDVENNNGNENNNDVEDQPIEDLQVAEDPLPFFAANSDDEEIPSLDERSSNHNSEDQNDNFDKNDVEDQPGLTSSDDED